MDKLQSLGDEALQSMAVTGDSEAEQQLVRRYNRLVRICARPYFLAGGDGEDLIQEGMMGLLAAIRQYDPAGGAAFKTYAELCVKRRLYTAIKLASRNKHVPLNTYIPIESVTFDEASSQAAYFLRDMEEQILARERADELKNALTVRLSRFEAEILELFLDGLSYQEMASRVSRSQKAVDNAIQRIRRKLAQYLKLGELSEGQ